MALNQGEQILIHANNSMPLKFNNRYSFFFILNNPLIVKKHFLIKINKNFQKNKKNGSKM